MSEYMQSNRDYWRIVLVLYAGYYISYPVAYVGALNLYRLAQEDFAKGINAYNKLIQYDYSIKDFLTIYENAGLMNPFEEETFRYIVG